MAVVSTVESRRSLVVKADDPKKDESGRSGARYTIELDISKNVIHLKKWNFFGKLSIWPQLIFHMSTNRQCLQ